MYAVPFTTSMNPEMLNLTMAARSVGAVAIPEERPITPSLLAADGVASKEAVKEPVWVGKLCDCQEAALSEQPGGAEMLVRLKLAGAETPETVAVTV